MAEMTPAQLLDGVQSWVEQQYQVAGLQVEVELHGGRFSPADLERYATRNRACRIALEGLRFEVNGSGRLQCQGLVVLVALAGDLGKKGSRALNVLDVVTPVTAALAGSRLGIELEDSIGAKDVRAANLYHAALDKQGTAAWVITWPVKFTHPRVR